MYRFLNIIVVIFLFIVLFSATYSSALAQNFSLGVAHYVNIPQGDVQDGSIVSSSNQGFALTTTPYDLFMSGVVTFNPAIAFGTQDKPRTYAMLADGQTSVLVNTSNGNIKKGDVITSSTTPGIGMKATKSGYVLGTALEDYSNSNTKAAKKIAVDVTIHFFTTKPTIKTNLLEILNLSAFAAVDEPLTVFRYFMAGLVVVLSFVLGFLSFGRMASIGIEALGRNPLASRMIQIGIIFNVFITVVIIGAGILVALFILRL